MGDSFFFFRRRLQLVILSYHLKILFRFSLPLLSSLSSSPSQSACLFKARSSTALSQEGGVGRSMHWHDPVNELCCSDEAGALEGLVCTAGFKCVIKNRVHLALQLSRYRASRRRAPSWQCFLGFTRERRIAWAEGLVRCSKVPTRWSSVHVAWARNRKWRAVHPTNPAAGRASWTFLSIHPSVRPSIHRCGWRAVIHGLFTSIFCGKLTRSGVKQPLGNHTGQILACCRKRSESLLKLKGF